MEPVEEKWAEQFSEGVFRDALVKALKKDLVTLEMKIGHDHAAIVRQLDRVIVEEIEKVTTNQKTMYNDIMQRLSEIEEKLSKATK